MELQLQTVMLEVLCVMQQKKKKCAAGKDSVMLKMLTFSQIRPGFYSMCGIELDI